MSKRLEQALTQQKQDTEQVVQKITGILGLPLDGQRRVEVANRNAYVYVRLRNNESEVIQAFNNQVAPAYNLPVLVERQGNRYVVIGVDTQRYENNWASFAPFLPRHGNTHSFNPDAGGGGDIVWVYSRQFTPLLTFPSGSLGGPNVLIHPYTLKNDDGTWKYIGNTGTLNLTTYNPTSPTGAIMVLVYVDSVSGNPGFLVGSGTVFANSITGASQITPYIPTITNPLWIPDSAIRLITGTKAINWESIYDVRQFLHTMSTGSSGGLSSVAVQDEGVPKGNVTTFDFVGSNVDVSVSGSVARVFVTGSTGGGSSFFVQDEGVPLGTAETLNVVGGNADITLSGTVARLFVTGSVGGSTLSVAVAGVGTIPNVTTLLVSGTNIGADDSVPGTALVLFNSPLAVLEEDGDPLIRGIEQLVMNDSIVHHTGTSAYVDVYTTGPQGFGYDYKINLSSTSGTLNAWLSHLDGSDPSSVKPLVFNIHGNRRECTSNQILSLASGTNWFNIGSAELASKTVELFAYAVWLEGGSFDFGLARIPYGQRGTDFSSTSTSEFYMGGVSLSSGDRMEVIGRVSVALSASPGRAWSAGANTLTHHGPIHETSWLEWQPVYSANGSMTWTTITTVAAMYRVVYNSLHFYVRALGTVGGTPSTQLNATLPFDSPQSANSFPLLGSVIDGGGVVAFAFLTAATPDQASGRRYDGANFSAGASRGINLTGLYQISP